MSNLKNRAFAYISLIGLTVFFLFTNSAPLLGKESKTDSSSGVSAPKELRAEMPTSRGSEQKESFLPNGVAETIQAAFLLTFAMSIVKVLKEDS